MMVRLLSKGDPKRVRSSDGTEHEVLSAWYDDDQHGISVVVKIDGKTKFLGAGSFQVLEKWAELEGEENETGV